MSNFFGQLHDDTTSYPSHRGQAIVSIECQASVGHIRDKDYEKESYTPKESFDFGAGEVVVTDTKIDTNFEPRLTVYSNVGHLVNPYCSITDITKKPQWKFVGVAAQKSVLESHKKEVLQVFTSGLVAVAVTQQNNAEICSQRPFQHGDPVHIRFPTAKEAEYSTKIRLCHAPVDCKLDILYLINGTSRTGEEPSGDDALPQIEIEKVLHNSLANNMESINKYKLPFDVTKDLALYNEECKHPLKCVTLTDVEHLDRKRVRSTSLDCVKEVIDEVGIYANRSKIGGAKNYRELIDFHYEAIYKIIESKFVMPSLLKLNLIGMQLKSDKRQVEAVHQKETLVNNFFFCHWMVLVSFNEILVKMENNRTTSKAFRDNIQRQVRPELGFMLFLKTFQKFECSVSAFIAKYIPCIGICRYPADNRSNGFMMVQLC